MEMIDYNYDNDNDIIPRKMRGLLKGNNMQSLTFKRSVTLCKDRTTSHVWVIEERHEGVFGTCKKCLKSWEQRFEPKN